MRRTKWGDLTPASQAALDAHQRMADAHARRWLDEELKVAIAWAEFENDWRAAHASVRVSFLRALGA